MLSRFDAGVLCLYRLYHRLAWMRVLAVSALAFTCIHFILLTNSATYRHNLRAVQGAKHSGMLISHSVMNRGHSARDSELTIARETLEYWWSLMHAQHNVSGKACPLSVKGPPGPEITKMKRYDVFVRQGIEIMEAMGFSNLTTCNGLYPTLAYVSPFTGTDTGIESNPLSHNVIMPRSPPQARPLKKIEQLLKETLIFSEDDEDLITKKFCYAPVFRPQQSREQKDSNKRSDKTNKDANPESNPKSDPQFCPKLLRLYRAIQAGKEPPLLTLFTWLPDVLSDSVRHLRRVMLVNMDQFKPFVQPVLVSDRRMVMALANSLSWPCLPVRALSPDDLPVFEPASSELMKTFNSTFYGYLRRISLLDASLLETLLAVKEKYLSVDKSTVKKTAMQTNIHKNPSEVIGNITSNGIEPSILLYGSAFYARNLNSVKKHSSLGLVAKERTRRDFIRNNETFLSYVIYNNKQNLSDLPPLKVDDPYLIPLLVSRSRAHDHVTIDASNTILSLYALNSNTLSDWDRVYLPPVRRNDSHNKLLGDNYLTNLKREKTKNWRSPIETDFGTSGDVIFREP
ncbi:hypothetical protein PoB_006969300 [Plakobranchus ocellatus]|uniref:Uncharacterized protein n=1 Tax=Plakobranchus ocellatus TaxID=259542 RepID=A0AAV4DFX7_9GAST|nr:hypothetical protein PoB_006969300 [Plakobranchus ocellatus]